MSHDYQPAFPPVTRKFVENAYRESRLILEYGSGGSTILAAEANKTIITVESDKNWLDSLIASAEAEKLPGTIIPVFTDIGETENWGYPDNDTQWRSWIDYPIKPWRYCQQKKLSPDLILIDGRFRVASFIASCVYTTQKTTLLFDDYVEREQYHVVETLLKPEKIIDKRMGVFLIEPELFDAGQVIDMLTYFQQPD